MPRPLKDFREYLSWLEKRGRLVRIKDELSPILEIPAVLRQAMYRKMPALLFENVRGHPEWKIAGNIFQSPELYAELLGVKRLEEIGERLTGILASGTETGILYGLSLLGKAKRILHPTREVGRAEFMDNVVENSPLDELPAFKTWPCDGGRYLTYPLVITRDPRHNTTNIGVYRVMPLDGRKAVIHWQIHKRGAEAYEGWREENMPVAIAIGGDPYTLLTGASPVPSPIDKYSFAALLRDAPIPVTRLPNGIPVPAGSEAVLEGYVKIGEESHEGPFGDHFGYCDRPEEKYPVIHVERLYYRDNPIYYGSVVGPPPLEDAVIGKIIERIFLPLIRMLVPEIVDINYPVYGCFQGMVIVSIDKRYPGQAKKVMNALWGLGQSSLTKIIVVVDKDVDVHNIDEVIWAVSANTLPGRDVVVFSGAHTDALDPSATYPSLGGKLGIDATSKLPEENYGKRWPMKLREDTALKSLAERILEKITGETGNE